MTLKLSFKKFDCFKKTCLVVIFDKQCTFQDLVNESESSITA